MLNRLPKVIMPLSMILGEIGNPKPRELARALGVSERTVFRWIKDDDAPKAVLLSLFWLTKWGQDIVNCDAGNDARLQAAIAAGLRRENEVLQEKLTGLGRIADFGAANDPITEVCLRPSVLAVGTVEEVAPRRDGGRNGRGPKGVADAPGLAAVASSRIAAGGAPTGAEWGAQLDGPDDGEPVPEGWR